MSTYVGVAEAAVDRAMAFVRPGDARPATATAVARMRRSLRAAQDAAGAMVAASEDLHFVNDFLKVHEGRNGGGDRWISDGRLAVGTLQDPD